MKSILLIGFSDMNSLQRGSSSWRGNYLNDILGASDFSGINVATTSRVIGYFAGKADADKYCFELDPDNIELKEKFLKIDYSVLGKSELISGQIKSAIFGILNAKESGINNFPFCIAVEEPDLVSLIEDEAVIKQLNKLKSKNDWLGIYKLFDPLKNIKERRHIWSNVKILDTLSFACAKLSEVYINLKFNFKTEKEKNDFLVGQKKYREETILLRERCIELNPKYAGYYSNLGYSYYQYVRELMTPGGRRDGKIMEEANRCIVQLDKALEIDPNRITDLYRKGKILTSVFPVSMKFSKLAKDREELNKETRKVIAEGIKCYQQAEEVFEIIPLIDEKSLQRYKKEYIKSLYNTAAAYNKFVFFGWDYAKFFLKLNSDIADKRDDIKSEALESSIEYMEKCIVKDSSLTEKKISLSEAIDIAKSNGDVCGVYKLYSSGKYFFQKYWYLSGYGSNENLRSNDARAVAERYLIEALKFPWTENFRRQSKAFIAERLCRLYITKGEYEKGLIVLKPFINDRTDYYIRYTYATAAYCGGKFEEASVQINASFADRRKNHEVWLGHLMLSCIEIKKGDTGAGELQLRKAIAEAGGCGKRNTERLYITQSFIKYKSGDKKSAIESLEEVLKINPGRTVIKERLEKWKSGEFDFDLLEI